MGKYTPMVLIEETNGEYRILENEIFGQWVLPSKAIQIAEGILRFYGKYNDKDIENYNHKMWLKDEEEFNQKVEESKKINKITGRPINKNEGFVYLLKCSDTYKIGFSNKVNRRIKELDVRPFKIELIRQWESSVAYSIETELHKRFKQYKIDNEWYSKDLPVDMLDSTIKDIENSILNREI